MALPFAVTMAALAVVSASTGHGVRVLEDSSECVTVDVRGSAAWRQDPNAEARYKEETAGNPSAPPFNACLSNKCFSYKFHASTWKPFQLVTITWNDNIKVDAIYGADLSADSESAHFDCSK